MQYVIKVAGFSFVHFYAYIITTTKDVTLVLLIIIAINLSLLPSFYMFMCSWEWKK